MMMMICDEQNDFLTNYFSTRCLVCQKTGTAMLGQQNSFMFNIWLNFSSAEIVKKKIPLSHQILREINVRMG